MTTPRIVIILCVLLHLCAVVSSAQTRDLKVTSVVLTPSTAPPGASISAVFTVKNVGTLEATFIIAQYQFFNNFEYVRFDSLAAGAERTVGPFNVVLPTYLTAGQYLLKACAFLEFSQMQDPNPADNCMEVPVTADTPNFIDMSGVSVSAGVPGIYPNVTFPMSATFENLGNTAPQSVGTSYFFSRDSVITTDDQSIGLSGSTATGGTGPGESLVVQTPARVGVADYAAYPPGTYYLGACIGIFYTQAEPNQTNNCVSGPVQLLSHLLTSDLRVTDIRFPDNTKYQGEPFTALVDVRNEGPGPAGNFMVTSSWRRSDDITAIPLGETRVSDVIAAGAVTTFPITIDMPPGTEPFSYIVKICLDAPNEVIETDELNNCRDSFQAVIVDGRRDFETVSVQADFTERSLGELILLTFTVRNNGYRFQPGTYGHVIWSTDSTINNQDPEMRQVQFGLLQGSDTTNTWTQVASLNVPMNSGVGTRYAALCVDWLNLIEETNEANNCITIPITVKPQVSRSFPDLQPLVLDVFESAPGGTVRVSFGVRNPGNLPTNPFTVHIDLLDSSQLLGNHCRSGGLGKVSSPGVPAGETQFFDNVSVQLPTSLLVPGRYYVAVCAIGTVQETMAEVLDSSLHALFVTTTPTAYNLTPTFTSTPFEVTPGSTFTVRYSVLNQGSGPVYQAPRHSIRWSTDATLSSDDIELGSSYSPAFDAPPAGRFDGIVSAKVPADAVAGTYYVLTCVDYTDLLLETNEDNNCEAKSIKVVASLFEWIDLRITDLSLSRSTAGSGDSLLLQFTGRNDGNDPTLNESLGPRISFQHSIRWSTDSTIDGTDAEIGVVAVDRMFGFTSRPYSISLEVPAGLSTGTYYIGVCADFSFSAVIELDEANNCASAPLVVSSADTLDLRITEIELDRTHAFPGSTVFVSFTTANEGNSGSASFVNSIRWSDDGLLSADDDLALRQVASGGANATSSDRSGPYRVDVPGTAKPGFHYIAVCADSRETFGESDEGNNCSLAVLIVDEDNVETVTLSMGNASGDTAATSGGALPTVGVGYGRISSQTGAVPYGSVVFSFRQNNVVASEVVVPASAPAQNVRLFADMRTIAVGNGNITTRTGVAIANPGTTQAQLRLVLRNAGGGIVTSGDAPLVGGGHVALFIDELHTIATGFTVPPGFASPTGFGSLEISSDQPVAVMGLRMMTNQRGEALMAPTAQVNMAVARPTSSIYSPLFVDGGGQSGSMILMNTSNATETGRVRFWNSDGSPGAVELTNGDATTTFNYGIPAGGVAIYDTRGQASNLRTASAEIIPDQGPAPVALVTFRVVQNGIVISESSASAEAPKGNMRMYADLTGGHNAAVVISNPNPSPVTFNTRLVALDGQQLTSPQRTLAAQGQIQLSITDILPSAPAGFRGLLTVEAISGFINVIALRTLQNSRGELLTTTMPMAETAWPAPTPAVFPQLADGGGYTSEIILINPSLQSHSAVIIGLYGDRGKVFQFSPAP